MASLPGSLLIPGRAVLVADDDPEELELPQPPSSTAPPRPAAPARKSRRSIDRIWVPPILGLGVHECSDILGLSPAKNGNPPSHNTVFGHPVCRGPYRGGLR